MRSCKVHREAARDLQDSRTSADIDRRIVVRRLAFTLPMFCISLEEFVVPASLG